MAKEKLSLEERLRTLRMQQDQCGKASWARRGRVRVYHETGPQDNYPMSKPQLSAKTVPMRGDVAATVQKLTTQGASLGTQPCPGTWSRIWDTTTAAMRAASMHTPCISWMLPAAGTRMAWPPRCPAIRCTHPHSQRRKLCRSLAFSFDWTGAGRNPPTEECLRGWVSYLVSR